MSEPGALPSSDAGPAAPGLGLPAALGAAFLALYVFTAYPAVSPYRDSGDMAAAAASLGVPHAPG